MYTDGDPVKYLCVDECTEGRVKYLVANRSMPLNTHLLAVSVFYLFYRNFSYVNETNRIEKNALNIIQNIRF